MHATNNTIVSQITFSLAPSSSSSSRPKIKPQTVQTTSTTLLASPSAGETDKSTASHIAHLLTTATIWTQIALKECHPPENLFFFWLHQANVALSGPNQVHIGFTRSCGLSEMFNSVSQDGFVRPWRTPRKFGGIPGTIAIRHLDCRKWNAFRFAMEFRRFRRIMTEWH